MKTIMSRTLAPAALAAVALVASTQSAHADGAMTFPAGEACDFSLEWAWSGGNLTTKEFKDENGNPLRVLMAGKGTVNTYTNLGPGPGEGKSISIRTDGSVAQKVFNADGSYTVTATGHNGLILYPGDVPAGPSTVQYVGKIVYTVGTNGVWTLVSTSGTATDVCEALAD
ncbi:MAG TPA: hypothetical protein VFS79_05715 [Arthrobacter sp.]|nr:hypothetical protein [Arthrobacter sp.]